MKTSLGNRLLLILLLVTLCVWLAVSAVIWVLGNRTIERQIDNQLRTLVSTVSYTIDAFITAGYQGAPEISLLDFEIVNSGENSIYTVEVPNAELPVSLNVWSGDRLQAMTWGSPQFQPPHQAGITDDTLPDGSQWRIIRSRLGDTNLWLVAGLNKAETETESTRLLFAILSPLLMGFLILIPLIYYAVRNGLKPLRELEEQIGQRSSNDLHAVETQGIPREVAPLVNALNKLLLQLSAAIEKEKRITADAAHELQTPLAAIKTEAQIALKHSHDVAKAPLIEIIERVNRASHAVKQLTALSRLESTASAFSQRVDLHDIFTQVREAYAEQLEAKGLQLQINDCHPLVFGNSDMIQILVDNLVRNTLNHALTDTVVCVTLTETTTSKLVIENACRDISQQEWQRITQRFYRVPGSQGDGSGLGMSIMQRICELHGARFLLGKRYCGDGFSVAIEFPTSGP
ncbi:MAG: hypothetical protein HRT77_07430 [Halioglobus sp.]|nr:hypothetical protein [Halioglobus sp.]